MDLELLRRAMTALLVAITAATTIACDVVAGLAGDWMDYHYQSFRVRFEIVVLELGRGEAGTLVPTDTSPGVPRERFISRIVGLPGEHVEITGGRVLVNGEELPEETTGESLETAADRQAVTFRVRAHGAEFTIVRDPTYPETDMAELAIPPDRYLLLGDFRNNARDGRFYGTVSAESLIGPVTVIYFSKVPYEWSLRTERIGLRPNDHLPRERGEP